MPTEIEPCLTIQKAAELLDLSHDYVRTLIKQGSLTAYKFPGGRNAPIRIAAASVHALQNASQLTPPKQDATPARRQYRPRRSSAFRSEVPAQDWGG